MGYVVSWSGGKDSCFACYQAMRQGYRVTHLVNFISKEYQRVRFHGTEARLIQMQSEAVGIPLVQRETTPDGYEQEFKETVRALIPGGVTGMVFGDIYLQEHRDWVERVCGEMGIQALEPLWGKSTEEVLTGFITSGFEAVIVSAQARVIEREWVGRRVNHSFMDYLKQKGVDLCGENGEYHTLVVDGPIFRKQIVITQSTTIERDGYYLLDTQAYRLVDKR